MTKKRAIYLAPVLAVAVSTLLISACSESDNSAVTQQVKEQSGDMMTEMKEAVTETSSELSESVASTIDQTKETVQEKSEKLVESAKTTVADVSENVVEKVEKAKTVVEDKVAQVTAAVEKSTSGDKTDMLAVAKESGCLACHAVDKKVVGPAWSDVGAKYRSVDDGRAQMIASVTKGSSGKWGSFPMPAYSPRVSDAKIASLVDFILTLE